VHDDVDADSLLLLYFSLVSCMYMIFSVSLPSGKTKGL
jgi:hypothetical protein